MLKSANFSKMALGAIVAAVAGAILKNVLYDIQDKNDRKARAFYSFAAWRIGA